MCPSSTAFAIPLGPTNPWLIDITKETLILRRDAFSASLRLLVPTFLLPHAPVALTSLPSQQSGTLSYHFVLINQNKILTFGIMLSPNYFRREISRWVSCYAIFKGWLLLSQPPSCLRNHTSLTTELILRDLRLESGLFPFPTISLARQWWLA